jgi:hypothetical protein
VFGEVSAVAELCDDVGVVSDGLDVFHFDYSFCVFESFEYLNFGGE